VLHQVLDGLFRSVTNCLGCAVVEHYASYVVAYR
jgi:hypothetical protein